MLSKSVKSNNKKKIVFLLPSPGRPPVGGYKIIYQYSNYLDDLGYNVTICFCPININLGLKKDSKIKEKIFSADGVCVLYKSFKRYRI